MKRSLIYPWMYLALFILTCGPSSAQDRYNILWITAEDLSPRLGAYGDRVARTPNLDRLAAGGVRYERAFATYGVCAPARHTLITGMYPTSTGAGPMRTWRRTSALASITDTALLNIPVYEATPPAGVKCFTEYLRAAGYYCTNNSKTDYQFRPPITAWDESSKTAHWRNRPDRSQPFFAVFNGEHTHESRTFKQVHPRFTDPADVTVPPYYPDTETVRQDIARHYDNIHALDTWVGEILDQLEEDGLLDSTIIFFFGDHGDGLPRAKRWVYDSGTRVPLLIRWPDGAGAGTVNEALVSFVDFAPTVLSLAELDAPAYMEGQVFAGGKQAAPRDYVYLFRDRMDPAPETIRAVRDERYQYVRNYRPELPYLGYIPYRDRAAMMQEILRLKEDGALGPEQWQFWATSKSLEELYDTQTDPDQIRNIAGDPAHFGKLTELRNAHADFLSTYGDLGQLPESELIRRLWPPAGAQSVTASPTIHVDGNRVRMESATEGASIAYRLSADENWRLYFEPIDLPGGTELEARAIRLGWKESEPSHKIIK
ncbi:arylsulfatase A-like enzyme [Lewinella aquimaris]|uniref:Arylsulfatase A-like enzyme n=1 Tax=Neolewinella aquimaris TaxID=1835722 RepID=A0A840EE80_9BACT|nr:sulfatase [Neolewinella aquimaris]MBB4079246.1 arylsulfatase A-like enzyme [Neolewinella aquimaris]